MLNPVKIFLFFKCFCYHKFKKKILTSRTNFVLLRLYVISVTCDTKQLSAVLFLSSRCLTDISNGQGYGIKFLTTLMRELFYAHAQIVSLCFGVDTHQHFCTPTGDQKYRFHSTESDFRKSTMPTFLFFVHYLKTIVRTKSIKYEGESDDDDV